MARVTIEDCVEEVPNRFELIMLAAQRAKRLGSGAQMTVQRDNDKNPVVSLREIAAKTILPEDLREELIRSYQRVVSMDEEDSEDMIDTMEGESEGGQNLQETGNRPESSTPSLEDIAGGSGS